MEESVASGGIADAGASQSASPASAPDSTSGSAAPAAQGTPDTGFTDNTEREGFIPRARFDEVNTRMSAAEKQMADWKAKYGWAESVQRDQLEAMSQWYAQYQGDPGDFLERAYQEALSHPVHGATVKSRIGRMLASMKAQQAPSAPERIEPGIPVMNERGEVVAKTYTDAQLEQLLEQKLSAALNPFKQDLETRTAEAKKAKDQAAFNSMVDSEIDYVKKRPGFEKHKKDIAAYFAANPGVRLRDAYDAVMDAKAPAEAEAKVLSDLQQKANAQTVNAGQPGGSATPKFKSFSEAHAYYEKHPDEAARMANR